MNKSRYRRTYRFIGGLILAAVVAAFTSGEKENQYIRQEEVAYQSLQQLHLFARVENEIQSARLGITQSVSTGNPSDNYDDICPELVADDFGEDEITTNTNIEEKTAYLTFDDGPSRNTLEILSILDQYQVKATFFVVSGNLSESGQEAVRLASERGHTIGMHADCHDYDVLYTSVEGFLKDIEKVFQMIQRESGKTPRIYRFPGGSYNSYGRKKILRIIPEMERRGFTYFDWTTSGEDAVGHPTASSIKRNLLKDLEREEQPVLLLHDGEINDLTVRVLPDIIEELVRRGYVFDTLEHREQYRFDW